jgi:hypothetical protein
LPNQVARSRTARTPYPAHRIVVAGTFTHHNDGCNHSDPFTKKSNHDGHRGCFSPARKLAEQCALLI